ncbi:cyclin-D4-2-like [Rosa chinensis]|uniref:cyclin-D4-2-like n=1 Tax=Rosa chinensis TaxID=74649 RepID=UPI000D08B7B8|nr:cyclin-D4-2-like [Rosa chinensis]XP_040362626.1 cyclin-D4-2-like [Rosa chinensis]XP_040362627.1 cyclin-D4-2-like [Rosa chinensis]XP_040362628.1 cyclin-D4-2-like [Rosa chinensis]XP_040362629.1 cyclin-D4-2-like [Rosa chinensis]XP_040362630.1 cyclin-D4-2-like [Rosa chinensis]
MLLWANAHFSFGPLCQYPYVSYLDHGLSAYEIPNGKAWTMQLLAVACLALAAKIKEINAPLYLDLQVAGLKNLFKAIEKEMCKFLDLLFNDSFLVEQKYVITTEGHPLPVLSSWQDRLLASKLTGLQSRSCFYQNVFLIILYFYNMALPLQVIL